MANEARRSILKGMQDHPHSVILSELIFKRMPFDVLALIAPIVLEKIEDGYSSFDALTSVDFCSYLLNRHYKSDAILELLGQEFYKENKRKPDRLSEVAKIIQKRLDLKNNKKSLKRKASIEFEKDEPFVKFSRSYVIRTVFYKTERFCSLSRRKNRNQRVLRMSPSRVIYFSSKLIEMRTNRKWNLLKIHSPMQGPCIREC